MKTAAATAELRYPPGPAGDHASEADLFSWLNENFARYGDIFRASIFGGDVYVVSNPQYIEHILRRNWRNYARKGQVVKRISLLLGNGLIGSNGEFWASQRRMIQPTFSRAAIDRLIGMIVDINVELLERWKRAAAGGESVNVTHDVSMLVLEITLTAIFGNDYATVAPYFEILAEHSERNMEFAQGLRLAGRVISRVVEQRGRDGGCGDDFLGGLMRARDREHNAPMRHDQLVREVMTLIVAGHETTAGLLNWLWYLFARHADVQARVSDEVASIGWDETPTLGSLARYAYCDRVMDEALRLYPPLWLMTRQAINADRLGEYLVPAGTEIYISPYIVQRSPALWDAPGRFDPDRMKPEHAAPRHELALCPFGAGPRNCIGELLARVEIKIHMMVFAGSITLVDCSTSEPEFCTGMNLLSKSDFLMQPRLNSMAA